MRAIPDGYTLSETFSYGKRGVDVFTNGSHLVFAHYMHDAELGKFTVTVSDPAPIGEQE